MFGSVGRARSHAALAREAGVAGSGINLKVQGAARQASHHWGAPVGVRPGVWAADETEEDRGRAAADAGTRTSERRRRDIRTRSRAMDTFIFLSNNRMALRDVSRHSPLGAAQGLEHRQQAERQSDAEERGR